MAGTLSAKRAAVVLSGGVGLGSYQAGALEALLSQEEVELVWLSGSSVGAVNAILVAGNRTGRQLAALQTFWGPARTEPSSSFIGIRHAQNWMTAIRMRLLGAPGQFIPRFWPTGSPIFESVYDLSPMFRTIQGLTDFRLVNAGGIRVSIATTDIQTGETIFFDTKGGDIIGTAQLQASCGFLPEFAPVDIDGRTLGDGGLSANAPVEIVLENLNTERIDYVFVVDLFAADGNKPRTMEHAFARKMDLIFGNQSLRILRAYARFGLAKPVLYLSYRADPSEAGSERGFDFSPATAADRWRYGRLDMMEALRCVNDASLEPLTLIRRN